MAEKLTLDTNVLFYAIDHRFPEQQSTATEVVRLASASQSLLTTITLGEFFVSTSRKLGQTKTVIRQHLLDFSALFEVVSYDETDLFAAARESEAGRFEFWDAVMLSAAERAGCTVCLSEDMHDGATLGRITVRNPFGAKGLTAAARAALSP